MVIISEENVTKAYNKFSFSSFFNYISMREQIVRIFYAVLVVNAYTFFSLIKTT